ncbi:MAG TPA: GntG family PLP-dependent aldolase [Pseudonocardiaceae bacterium]
MPGPIVELRSDTFTTPTQAMLDAMVRAPLGDDVYAEDPTVRALEEHSAHLLGKEAGCLMPSGTMSNLAAMMAHAPRGTKVLAGRQSDIYAYEAHGVSVLGGLALEPVETDAHGRLRMASLTAALPEDADDPQFAVPAVVCVENTANRSGGVALTAAELAEVADFAAGQGIRFHIDGARIFNAAVALGVAPADLVRRGDSVQFCLSKGLSAPIGSVVVGSASFVQDVRRIRKMLGGGMRQAGVIAAAGLVALHDMVDRLAEDHATAQVLADHLADIPGVEVDPIRLRTNMVRFRVTRPGLSHPALIELAAQEGVRVAELGRGTLRAVTHRNVSKADVLRAVSVIAGIVREHRAVLV